MGAIDSIIDALTGDATSDVLTGAAKGALNSRQADDYLKLNKGNLQLARDKFATNAPGVRMNQNIRASLANSATPASVQWGGKGSGLRGEVPQFSGGIKSIYGALADPSTRAMSSQVMHDTLMSQLAGGGGKDSSLGDAADVGHAGALENALGGAGLASSIANALKKGIGSATPSKTSGGSSADWQGPIDQPGWFDPSDYGRDPGNYGEPDPVPSVDTSYDFSNDPNLRGSGTDDAGGYYDENGQYIDPFGGGGTGGDVWGDE